MIKLWLNFSRYTLIPVKCKSSSLSYNLTCLESQHRNKSSSKPVLNLFILVENQKRNPAICRKANSKSNGKMARIVVVGTMPAGPKSDYRDETETVIRHVRLLGWAWESYFLATRLHSSSSPSSSFELYTPVVVLHLPSGRGDFPPPPQAHNSNPAARPAACVSSLNHIGRDPTTTTTTVVWTEPAAQPGFPIWLTV